MNMPAAVSGSCSLRVLHAPLDPQLPHNLHLPSEHQRYIRLPYIHAILSSPFPPRTLQYKITLPSRKNH